MPVDTSKTQIIAPRTARQVCKQETDVQDGRNFDYPERRGPNVLALRGENPFEYVPEPDIGEADKKLQ